MTLCACSPARNSTDAGTAANAGDEGIPYSFFAIHLEPGFQSYENLQGLVEFVALAEKYNIKLTLEFTPQWAEFILADPKSEQLLRSWQQAGHEVGAHHHCASIHTGWDGYTNRPESDWKAWRQLRHPDKAPEPLLGNMDAYMKLLNQLAAPQVLKTMTMCDDDVDLTGSITVNLEGFLSGRSAFPALQHIGQKQVYYLAHRFIGGDGQQRTDTLEGAQAEYLRTKPGEVLGAVTHNFDYMNGPPLYEQWFQFLHAKDPEGKFSKTAAEVAALLLKDCLQCNEAPIVCGDGICTRDAESELSCQRDCCDDPKAYFACLD